MTKKIYFSTTEAILWVLIIAIVAITATALLQRYNYRMEQVEQNAVSFVANLEAAGFTDITFSESKEVMCDSDALYGAQFTAISPDKENVKGTLCFNWFQSKPNASTISYSAIK